MRAIHAPFIALLALPDDSAQGNGIQRIVVTRKLVQAKDGTKELPIGQAQEKAAVARIDQQQRVHDTEFDGAKMCRHTSPQRIQPDEAGNGTDKTAISLTDRPASA